MIIKILHKQLNNTYYIIIIPHEVNIWFLYFQIESRVLFATVKSDNEWRSNLFYHRFRKNNLRVYSYK